MQIKFEPSGTSVHKDQLKIRLDLFPDVGEKSYTQNYVNVPVIPVGGYPGKVDAMGQPVNQKQYDTWLAGLPRIWQLNPCLSVFVGVDANVTKTLLSEYVNDILKSDVLATIDDAMIQANSAHLISPYMRGKVILSSAKTTTFDEAAKTNINTVLANFTTSKLSIGLIEPIQPQSIDVGPGADGFSSSDGGLNQNHSWVYKTNPANATGTLDTVEVYIIDHTDATGFKCGTFTGAGTSKTVHSYASIGNVTHGSKQTFTGLAIAVTSGEYLGTITTAGKVANKATGADGLYVMPSTDTFGGGAYTYTSYSSTMKSAIYATGTETPTGWANIKNIRMGTGVVLATDISHIWMGTTAIAVADIAEFPVGVAV
jgi:hypothetical protein